jgi:hypothetical protein
MMPQVGQGWLSVAPVLWQKAVATRWAWSMLKEKIILDNEDAVAAYLSGIM